MSISINELLSKYYQVADNYTNTDNRVKAGTSDYEDDNLFNSSIEGVTYTPSSDFSMDALSVMSYDELTAFVDELPKDADVKAELDTANETLTSALETFTKLQNEIIGTDDVPGLESRLNSAIAERDAALAALNKAIQDLEDAQNALRRAEAAERTAASEKESAQNDYNTALSTVSNERKQAENAAYQEAMERYEAQEDDDSIEDDDKESFASILADIRSSKGLTSTTEDSRIIDAESKLGTAEIKYKKAQTALSVAQSNATAAQTARRNAQGTYDARKTVCEQLNTTIDNKYAELNASSAQIDSIQTSITAIESKISKCDFYNQNKDSIDALLVAKAPAASTEGTPRGESAENKNPREIAQADFDQRLWGKSFSFLDANGDGVINDADISSATIGGTKDSIRKVLDTNEKNANNKVQDVITNNANDFMDYMSEQSGISFVTFCYDGCSYCRKMEPFIESAYDALGDNYSYYRTNNTSLLSRTLSVLRGKDYLGKDVPSSGTSHIAIFKDGKPIGFLKSEEVEAHKNDLANYINQKLYELKAIDTVPTVIPSGSSNGAGSSSGAGASSGAGSSSGAGASSGTGASSGAGSSSGTGAADPNKKVREMAQADYDARIYGYKFSALDANGDGVVNDADIESAKYGGTKQSIKIFLDTIEKNSKNNMQDVITSNAKDFMDYMSEQNGISIVSLCYDGCSVCESNKPYVQSAVEALGDDYSYFRTNKVNLISRLRDVLRKDLPNVSSNPVSSLVLFKDGKPIGFISCEELEAHRGDLANYINQKLYELKAIDTVPTLSPTTPSSGAGSSNGAGSTDDDYEHINLLTELNISNEELQLVKDNNIDLTAYDEATGLPLYIIAKAKDGKYHIYERQPKKNGKGFKDELISIARKYGTKAKGKKKAGLDIVPDGSGYMRDTKDVDASNKKAKECYYLVDVNDDFTDCIAGTTHKKYKTESPLSFDLNGDGIKTSDNIINYDIDGDGIIDRIYDSADAVLVFDKDGDGISGENGSECFGNNTDLDGDGVADGYANGFEALKALALRENLINNADDMVLDEKDLKVLEAKYGLKLKANGYNSEAQSLFGLGVTQINLSNKDNVESIDNFDGKQNSVMYQQGTSVVVNGETVDIGDIWHKKVEENRFLKLTVA